jgi:hypothetical protein
LGCGSSPGYAGCGIHQADQALAFSGETDRVYGAVTAPLVLGTRAARPARNPRACLMVVWEPWDCRCAALADMPLDGLTHTASGRLASNTPVSLSLAAPGAAGSQFEVT